MKIEKKIVGFKVKTETKAETELEKLNEHKKRPFALRGMTYKIKPPTSDSALYMTVNDICLNEGTEHEQYVPFEVFLNSKHMDSFEWIATVTRLISAVLRKGGETRFLVKELEGMFSPNAGYFGKVPNKTKGKYYNSVVSEIGSILRFHMEQLGVMNKILSVKEENDKKEDDKSENIDNDIVGVNGSVINMKTEEVTEEVIEKAKSGPICPVCSEPGMVLMDGCYTCVNGCGHSKCG